MLFLDVGASHLSSLHTPTAMTLSVALNYRMADDLSFTTVHTQTCCELGNTFVLCDRRFRTHNKFITCLIMPRTVPNRCAS